MMFELMVAVAICFALSPAMGINCATCLALMAFSLFFQAGFFATLFCCIGLMQSGNQFIGYLLVAFLLASWSVASNQWPAGARQQD